MTQINKIITHQITPSGHVIQKIATIRYITNKKINRHESFKPFTPYKNIKNDIKSSKYESRSNNLHICICKSHIPRRD